MHHWNEGDKVDWKGINDAAKYIGTNLRKYGRMDADYKEKWGTVRVHTDFGWSQIHSITHPGYAYCQYPEWLWKIDCHYGHYIARVLNIVAVPYQQFLYRLFYTRAVRKWPHLAKEITHGADHWNLIPELTKGADV
jgi:hypothetical protein